MFAGSTVAIDNARIDERLSAFKSVIGAKEPVDNYFTKNQTIDWLWKKKKMQDGGRQILYPISTGENPNMLWASDYDEISTSASSNARDIVFPFVNIFSSFTISDEELREIADDNNKMYDRVKFKRDELMNTYRKMLNEAIFAAAQVADRITAIPIAIDSTGSLGSLSAATEAGWAANEDDVSDTWGNAGYTSMLTMYNDIVDFNAMPKIIVTTQTLYESYENDFSGDIRYSNAQGTLGRGASELQFKKTPIIFDGDCTADAMYFIDTDYMFPMVDTQGDFRIDDFINAEKQFVKVAKSCWRGNIICNKRNAQGKLLNIT